MPKQGGLGLVGGARELPHCPACLYQELLGLSAAARYAPHPGDGLPCHSLGTVEHPEKLEHL